MANIASLTEDTPLGMSGGASGLCQLGWEDLPYTRVVPPCGLGSSPGEKAEAAAFIPLCILGADVRRAAPSSSGCTTFSTMMECTSKPRPKQTLLPPGHSNEESNTKCPKKMSGRK